MTNKVKTTRNLKVIGQSGYENINWRTVGNCIKATHDRLEPDITVRMHGLRRICADETAYRKGFSYITSVYDMDRNRVVWIHEGNGLEVFRLFCEALTPEERERIEIIAGDGAQWIDTCKKLYFPNATRCIDFFHVVEWTNSIHLRFTQGRRTDRKPTGLG